MESRSDFRLDAPLAEETGKMTEELSGLFSAQFQFQRDVKNNECEQSDECIEAGAFVDEIRVNDYPVERCNRCNRLRAIVTPDDLAMPAFVAVRLFSLKEGGAQFGYPDSLSPTEWAVIEALQSAKRNDEWEEAKRREEEIEMEKRMAAMNRANRGV